MNKLRSIGTKLAVGAVTVAPMFAQTEPTAMPDPTTTVTSVTAIAYACGAVAAAILAWKVGSKLVSKLVK